MRQIILVLVLPIAFFSCKSISEQKLPIEKSSVDSTATSDNPSKVTTTFKGDTLYIYDEKFSWEPFIDEKVDLEKIRKTYQETKRELNYNNNSEFNDTLITYAFNDNEIILYANQDDKNIRQAKIVSNGILEFNQHIEIGLQLRDFLKKFKVTVEEKKISKIIICPDEDELQEIILEIDNANRISAISFYGYYD
jgi:hypothetical protein